MQVDLINVILFSTWASLFSLINPPGSISAAVSTGSRARRQHHYPLSVQPQFEDTNASVVAGPPGGQVTLHCNIFMLQDHMVSWVHRHSGDGRLELLSLGNATHTLDSRIAARFQHPSDWALHISDLRPEDAGEYLCQIATFPEEKVRIVYLEIRGPMIEIVRDQVVYNAGSHLDVACVYRNSTPSTRRRGQAPSAVSSEVHRLLQAMDLDRAVPKDTIVWLHNGRRFSHRNRRRVKTVRKLDHILSVLSIKSAILEDSGNYSCLLGATNHSDTVRITVVNGEHSAAIYKNSDLSPATSGVFSSAPTLISLNRIVFSASLLQTVLLTSEARWPQ